MKNLWLLFILLISCYDISLAQYPPNGGGKRGGRMPYDQRPAIGTISGSVIDSTNQQPVQFATVALYLAKNDSLVLGGISNEKGQFTIAQVRPARYVLQVDFIGYQSKKVTDIRINRENINASIGTILLQPTAINIDAVEVNADRSFMQSSIDRKVYNASKVVNSAGASAVEVLENIPSVEVDIDGNLSLRGDGNVTVLIDGKPSGLTGSSRNAVLDQLPANSIESVEVITNPSAKYDPDGMSGIINIVLKKNKKRGVNGSLSLGWGTINNYDASVNVNYRTKQFNVFGSYNYRFSDRWRRSITNRTELYSDTTTLLDLVSNSDNIRKSHTIRAGGEYYVSPKTSIGLTGLFNRRDGEELETLTSNRRSLEDDTLALFYRYTTETALTNGFDVSASFTQKFAQKKQQLVVNANYSNMPDNESVYFIEEDVLFVTDEPYIENDVTLLDNIISTVQADYEHPFNEKSMLELGYKSIFRRIGNNFEALVYDYDTELLMRDDSRSNDFNYKEDVHALYALWGYGIGNFSFKIGSRFEQAFTNSTVSNNPNSFTNNYFSIFPSAFINQKIGDNVDVHLSYTRRINRPRVRSLNPFTDYSNPLNLRQGNPYLRPEYIDVYELGYDHFINGINLSANMYYRFVRDVIRRNKEVDETGVALLTFENFSTARSYGLELVAAGQITKKWRVNASANFYNSKVDGSNVNSELTSEGWGWNAKLLTNIKLWPNADLQLSGRYSGVRIIPQGLIKPIYTADVTLKQSFLKKKASLSINLRDIFDTRRFALDIANVGYEETIEFKRQSRVLSLNFTYKFGKQDRRGRRGNRGADRGGGFDDGGF